MKTGAGTLNFWNTRKNYGVVNTGKDAVYVKRYMITNPASPMELSTGDNVEFDRSINGYEIKSTCDLTPKVTVKNESNNL